MTSTPAPELREEIATWIEQSLMWSPAGGPVEWDREKVEATKRRAHDLASSILALIREREGKEIERLRSALTWAMGNIHAPIRRIEHQNEQYFDAYCAALAVLEAEPHP